MAEEKEPARCAACGCKDLQITAWVMLNGKEVVDEEGPDNQVFCPDCDTMNADIEWPEDARKREQTERHEVLRGLAEAAFEAFRNGYEAYAARVYNVDGAKGYLLGAAEDRACSHAGLEASRAYVRNQLDEHHTVEERVLLTEALTNLDLESVTWEGAKVVRHILQGPIS
ncbi:MAG: hypothetical protein GY769_20170 [bacterium]|nr:hypothetical protein [bacterium]